MDYLTGRKPDAVYSLTEDMHILNDSPKTNSNERKHGEWIEREVVDEPGIIEEWQSARCSVCGLYHTTPYMYYFHRYNFCPSCGADMRKKQNDNG